MLCPFIFDNMEKWPFRLPSPMPHRKVEIFNTKISKKLLSFYCFYFQYVNMQIEARNENTWSPWQNVQYRPNTFHVVAVQKCLPNLKSKRVCRNIKDNSLKCGKFLRRTFHLIILHLSFGQICWKGNLQLNLLSAYNLPKTK